ncbi:MAG: Holliday junction resolvase RuvX [Lachnospiraceae bacterium]|jgi:RNAse H-fold protein YqgF|uniref:Holliday junction resolvase RuvX n=1 Tax=Roseburia sp. 1XD42-69 TaxID=2320088 RepID=UPI000EA1CCAC|nr:Holliday junction resolvase RuvX [Roseburia sp. 1XD42-69]MCI8875639.1 Holliday junction resolvase RuvX [Lachnospiraceae bacterium]RKJ65724.1 Holliday junction resolvase RuvX [Roseburia sp. 1XD42-69]
MRILGLDFGGHTVGVAVSDSLGITAQGVEIIRRKSPGKLRQTLARIESLVSSYGVEKIVLGYPKNMNGTEGERCEKTKEFRDMLVRRVNLPVELWDERLTTVAADNIMTESNITGERRKEYVDEIAAMLILQGYLDYLSNQSKKEE